MTENNNMLIVQDKIDSEIKSIITTSAANQNMNLTKYELSSTIKNVSLDTNELLSISNTLYNEGDTKKDLAETLLNYIKDNKKKYKIFSKLAKEMLDEGWCEKIND